LVGLLENWVTR